MASYTDQIRRIDTRFRKTILKDPKAGERFSHDLRAAIEAHNKAAMGNVQTNKQSGSGTATNQNRVIGGQGGNAIDGGSANSSSIHDEMAALGVSQKAVRTEALRHATLAIRQGRPDKAAAALQVARDAESPHTDMGPYPSPGPIPVPKLDDGPHYGRGGKGPIPGRPIVYGNLLERNGGSVGNASLAGLLRTGGRKRSRSNRVSFY